MKTFTEGHDLLCTSTKFLLNTAHVWVGVLMFQKGEEKGEKTERAGHSARASDENMFGSAPHLSFGCSSISQIWSNATGEALQLQSTLTPWTSK